MRILLFLALFGGCATSYQSDGFSGGYTNKRIAAHSYDIVFRGNRYTSHLEAYQYALRRAAEMAIRSGYAGFQVVAERPTTGTPTASITVTMFTAAQIAAAPSGTIIFDAAYCCRY